MRSVLFIMALSGCVGVEGQAPGSIAGDRFARSQDTDVVPLVATRDSCPAGFDEVSRAHPDGFVTCVHPSATVLGSYDAGVLIGDGATVERYAHIGQDAVLGSQSFVGSRAVIGIGSEIGVQTIVGRGAVIGANTSVGADSYIGRRATLGDDVDASVGDLNVSYGASLGHRCDIQGAGVMLGSLANIGDDCVIGGQVVVARSSTFGDHASLGTGTIVGPNVTAGADVSLGAGGRVRKGGGVRRWCHRRLERLDRPRQRLGRRRHGGGRRDASKPGPRAGARNGRR